jgi:signal transduction histidine kinase
VQAVLLDGEHVKGRLFWIDRAGMRVDDLVVGALVARLAAARLDGVFHLARLEESAANKERLKVARDLHDSLMQMLTGTALQLTAATRLIDHEAAAARTRLSVAREQIEEGEETLRGLIRRLRVRIGEPLPKPPSLEARLLGLIRRLEEQWPPRLVLAVGARLDRIRENIADEIMLIVREAVLNAARHADASHVHVSLRITPGALADEADVLRLSIRDDGRGFPFTGELGLDQLDARGEGPVTLKERVLALGADLRITSSSAGAELVVTFTKGWERDGGGDSSDPRR